MGITKVKIAPLPGFSKDYEGYGVDLLFDAMDYGGRGLVEEVTFEDNVGGRRSIRQAYRINQSNIALVEEELKLPARTLIASAVSELQ